MEDRNPSQIEKNYHCCYPKSVCWVLISYDFTWLIQFCTFYFAVPPTRIELKRINPYFDAEKTYNISCSTFGSNPQPYTRIWHRDRELEPLEIKAISHLESRIVSKFDPRPEDDGSFLVCKSENTLITNSAVEDQWKITVKCKHISSHSISLPKKIHLISILQYTYLDYLPTFVLSLFIS